MKLAVTIYVSSVVADRQKYAAEPQNDDCKEVVPDISGVLNKIFLRLLENLSVFVERIKLVDQATK